jgi:GNAT superfamily N-acetyltransferase
MSEVDVRPVVHADHAEWRALWDGYNAFYGRTGATALTDDVVQTTWARFFERDEPVHALVASVAGRVAGLAHYLFHRSTILREPICYMQDLFTADAHRGGGIGRALITRVYEDATREGCSRVYWHTHESNITAMRLYDSVAEKSGFIVYRHLLPPRSTP